MFSQSFTHELHSTCSMDVPKEHLSTLLDHGLYSSARILVLYGDSLFRQKEYRRAIQIYKQTLQYHKIIPKQNAAASLTTRSSFSVANRSSSPGSLNPSALNENEIKFRIATCHNSLNENRAALTEMEGIPSKSRNLEMNLMMAKFYRNSRHTRDAIGCFKECLRNCPYILDAIIALAELGVSAKDSFLCSLRLPNTSGRPSFDHLIRSFGCCLAIFFCDATLC